jgi:hypothetical protein
MLDLLADLREDGDFIGLGDGRALRLRIEPDDVNPFDDDEFFGRIGWPVRDDGGRDRRPQGFDGNAEKVTINRDAAWWQPPADAPKRSDPEFAKLRRHAIDLAEYGYSIVTLELLGGEDGYGRPIVLEVASLGAVDLVDFDPNHEYLTEVVGDLASELAS